MVILVSWLGYVVYKKDTKPSSSVTASASATSVESAALAEANKRLAEMAKQQEVASNQLAALTVKLSELTNKVAVAATSQPPVTVSAPVSTVSTSAPPVSTNTAATQGTGVSVGGNAAVGNVIHLNNLDIEELRKIMREELTNTVRQLTNVAPVIMNAPNQIHFAPGSVGQNAIVNAEAGDRRYREANAVIQSPVQQVVYRKRSGWDQFERKLPYREDLIRKQIRLEGQLDLLPASNQRN